MRHLARGLTVIVVVLAALFLGACGRSHSPAGPSAPPSSPSSGNATITGTLTTPAAPSSVRSQGAVGLTVSIVGTNLAAPVGGNGTFIIGGVPPLDVVLKFEGPGVSASVSLGAVQPFEQIHISVTVNGNTATLDSQQRTGTNNSVEAEGRIDDLDATPRRFLMSGAIVDASDATIRRADGTAMTFDDLRRGDRVHVRGTREGTTIRATEVVDQNSAQPPVTLSGTVAGVTGSCPSLTITLSGVSGLSAGTRNTSVNISTRASTTFAGKACADVRSGDLATVVASRQADDCLVATRVEAKNPPPVDFSGTVAGISGGCPNVTISVSGISGLSVGAANYTVNVLGNPSTTWPTKTCGAITSGDTVSVTASRQPDGSYLASRVDAKTPAVTVTFSGTIATTSGACPAITLAMSGISALSVGPTMYSATVVTNASTAFPTTACASIKPNDAATIVAVKQSDGTYLATKVDAKGPATYTVTGTITSLSGSCPTLKLIVGGVTLSTNASTTWATESCGMVKVGDSATVVKIVQGDGSYLAISVDAKSPAPVTFSGTIGAVAGTCPSLTIGMTAVSGLASVGARTYTATVTTGAATSFPTLACAAIAAGRTATVVATKQNDGSYLASKVDAQ